MDTSNKGYSIEATNQIGSGYKILGSQILDLDNNQDFEELYFVRDNLNNPDSLIEIFVFNIDGDKYEKTSQVLLGIDNNNSLTVSLLDINGDSLSEVVCQGFSTNGQQILDVFRINYQNLTLSPLLNLTVKGSIEIRDDNPFVDDTFNISGKTIIVHRDNPETPSDPIDLIREIYIWQPLARTFQIGKSEIIQSETISKEKIQNIYYGDEKVFRNFLAGSWMKIDPVSGSLMETVYFSPGENLIFYYNGEILESYNWGSSRKLIHNKLYIESENTLIESLKCSFYITAENYDKITASINGVFSDMNGTYARVNIPMEQFKRRDSSTASIVNTGIITGLFKGNQGFDILFQFPKITIMTSSSQINAIGTIYQTHGINVLEWQFPDGTMSTLKLQQSYQIKYNTRNDSGHEIKTLVLEPVSLNADRFIPLNAPSIHLEQINLEKAAP
jgi:hypothetical protein